MKGKKRLEQNPIVFGRARWLRRTVLPFCRGVTYTNLVSHKTCVNTVQLD